MIDMRRRNPREENTPPAGDRKARGARFLLELIENQKRHKALRNKGSRETSADECVSAARLSCTVQEKALSKEAASCSVVSQTCSSQTKLRREKSLTEISNFVSSATLVTMEATEVTGQEAERRTFVGNPGRSLSQEAACVPAVSPQRSRTLSGTRTRVTASTSRSPRTSSGSPSKTPPKRQQAHREQGSQTASSPRRSASHSPSAANHSPSAASHSPSAAPSRSPRSEKRLAVTPPQFCRSKSDPSSKPAESTSRSPQKSHPVSPKRSRRSDVLQVKPLVNTYHVITERPRIRPRKGAPKDLQSRNVKEAFTWKNTSNSIDTPRSSVEVANTCTVKELKTLSANGPLEKARSETIVNGSFTLRSPAIHSIPPISVRVNHSQLSDVHSLSTGCIDRVSNLYDDLVEEYRMPSPPHCSKKHSNNSKPSLVSSAFHPPPCPRATSKGVAMYIPLRGDVSKSKILPASSAKPPRIRAYNRSEVLAFMKRKRLERRQTQLKGSHSVTDMTRTTTLRAAEEPIAVSTPPEAQRNFAVVEKRTPLRSTEVAAEVMNCARKLSEAAVVAKQARANAPEMDHFSKLLFNFDRGVSDILGKCGLDTVQLQQAVKRHTSTDIPVVDRLDKAMKQFESLLVKLGLRESRLIVEEPCTDASVLSWKTQFQLSPPRPKAIALQSNLQDTPRPQHARLRSPVELAVAGTTATCSSVGGGNKSSSLEGVEKAVQTESMGANPNFVYEWRDKYLVGGWHSSTPKYPRSTTQDQVLLDDLNLSHISCEVQNDKSSSAHTSSTPISEIDNSALDQARQVLRQLAASEKNIKSAQRVLDDIRVIEGDSKHTTNGREKTEERNTVKRSTEGRKSCSKGVSKSRNHKHRFNNSVPGASNDCVTLSGIEENDILEEAKRVLKELSENQKNSRSNSRTDVSRNLMESFDRAATEDSKKGQEVTVSKLPSRDQRERKIAPEALSCLVTNELDYLEDCNDALLKMSEVSRAQCYAFAKETSLANEFLSKDAAKKSMSSRADLSEPDPAVPAVGDDLVEELRRSLREAFDQIEQQSRDMSFLRRDMTASKAHDGLETVRQTPANTLKDYLVKPILHSEGPLKISDKSSIVPSEASSTTVDTTDVVNDKKLGLAVTQAVRSGSRLSTDAQRTSSRVKSDTEEMSEEEHHSTFRDVSSSKVDSSKEHRLKIEVDLSNKRQVRSSNDSSWVKQDSESVSQDTRSRSSEQINKSTKSSVSVSTVKTLNSKPEVVASPVRIKSASFSTEHDTLEKDPTSSDTLNKEIHSLAKTISTDDYGSNDSDSKTSENGLNSDEKLDEGREQTSDMVRSPGSSTTGQSGLVHQHQPSERPTIQRDGETSGPHHEVPSLHAHNRNMKTSSTALVSRDGSAVAGEPADPLVSALVDYMERGEKLWEKHRCEGFRLLKGVTSGLAATSTGPTAVSSAPGSNSNLFATLGSVLLAKIDHQQHAERKDSRGEIYKLLSIIAKRKSLQEKANKGKALSKSTSSSSDQQSCSNSSSDESGELVHADGALKEAEVGHTKSTANGSKRPGSIEISDMTAPSNNKGVSSNTTSNSCRSVSLGSADLIENAELLHLLIKRNAEIAQKEKFVKYLERERQKIERRSEAIKKREVKLMAEMKAALERERESKVSFVKDALSVVTDDGVGGTLGGELKERPFRPNLRPMSARRPRRHADSSGSEEIASLSETDASDIEGSRQALRDEEEREVRQLEKLRKTLETPDSTRRPGRKEMFLRRIEVLEKLLANNRAAVAMLESATHVMPKIRRPRVAVKDKTERIQTQESEESDVSIASRDSMSSERTRFITEVDKSKDHKSDRESSIKSEDPTLSSTGHDKVIDVHVYSKSDSFSVSAKTASLSQETASEKAFSASPLGLVVEPNTSSGLCETDNNAAPVQTVEIQEEITGDMSKSDSDPLHSEPKSSSSSDSSGTKNRKVDTAMNQVVESLKDDTIKEVVKATRVDTHAAKMMERLVGEAIGDILKANVTKPADLTGPGDLAWLSEDVTEDLSPISSLNGSLAQIGQQIFVDDASQQVCIRKIPNKPPPPYTPPKAVPTSEVSHQQTAVSIAPPASLKSKPRPPEPVVPMTLGELQTEASHAAEYLFAQLVGGRSFDETSYEHSHCEGVADMAKLQYGEMLFDVAKETAEKMFRVGRNSSNEFLRPLPPKEHQQTFIDALVGAVLAAEKSKTTRPKCIWSYINGRRMDYIDLIMSKEVREEEREWTEYTRCLEQVREQLVEQITAHVIDSNVSAVLAAL